MNQTLISSLYALYPGEKCYACIVGKEEDPKLASALQVCHHTSIGTVVMLRHGSDIYMIV